MACGLWHSFSVETRVRTRGVTPGGAGVPEQNKI